MRVPMTQTQKIYAALDGALTGPSTDPRRNGQGYERLTYLTDAVVAALKPGPRRYEDVDLGYTLFCALWVAQFNTFRKRFSVPLHRVGAHKVLRRCYRAEFTAPYPDN